jgi:hypothetical protein
MAQYGDTVTALPVERLMTIAVRTWIMFCLEASNTGCEMSQLL